MSEEGGFCSLCRASIARKNRGFANYRVGVLVSKDTFDAVFKNQYDVQNITTDDFICPLLELSFSQNHPA